MKQSNEAADVEVDLFATIEGDKKIASSVVALSEYWYRRGWREGVDYGFSQNKVGVWLFPIGLAISFGSGYLVGGIS